MCGGMLICTRSVPVSESNEHELSAANAHDPESSGSIVRATIDRSIDPSQKHSLLRRTSASSYLARRRKELLQTASEIQQPSKVNAWTFRSTDNQPKLAHHQSVHRLLLKVSRRPTRFFKRESRNWKTISLYVVVSTNQSTASDPPDSTPDQTAIPEAITPDEEDQGSNRIKYVYDRPELMLRS